MATGLRSCCESTETLLVNVAQHYLGRHSTVGFSHRSTLLSLNFLLLSSSDAIVYAE